MSEKPQLTPEDQDNVAKAAEFAEQHKAQRPNGDDASVTLESVNQVLANLERDIGNLDESIASLDATRQKLMQLKQDAEEQKAQLTGASVPTAPDVTASPGDTVQSGTASGQKPTAQQSKLAATFKRFRDDHPQLANTVLGRSVSASRGDKPTPQKHRRT